jgi:predicted CoA-binding protein
MKGFPEKIQKFLDLQVIAVSGVSSKQPGVANYIFRKFRDSGYKVFPVNPATSQVEGVDCFPNLTSIPNLPEGVVIASPPSSAKSIIEECISLEIKYVWFHSSINQGSLDEDAAKLGEEKGLNIICTGCPMMYIPPIDFGHKCIKWVLKLTGKIPKK